jgi:arsenite-transporting ATPase
MQANTKFMLFTGKGGVGKTSLASAVAYKLANSGKKVLLVSTDPAHSLEDIFEMSLGPEPKKVLDNLYAMQIEPKSVLESSLKATVEALSQGLTELLGAKDLESLLGQSISELQESPGSDELAAFEVFKQLVLKGSQDYDVVIFDTAPTGHTLRFLRLPEILEGQLNLTIETKKRSSRLLSAVKKLLPFYNMSKEEEEELRRLQEEEIKKLQEALNEIKQVKNVLANKEITKIFAVANPEGLSFFETKKLIKTLNKYGFDVSGIIINKVLPEIVNDPYLQEWKRIQKQWLKKFQEELGKYPIYVVELLPHEIRGAKSISELANKINI